MKKKGELPEEIKKQLARYEEWLQYDNATVSAIDAHRNSLPNRQLINNSSYDTSTTNRVHMSGATTNHASSRQREKNKMDIYYDEKAGMWDVKKEPYVYIEVATEEDYELYKKMVAYWKEHHDAEGNEIG